MNPNENCCSQAEKIEARIRVYVVQHLNLLDEDTEDVKMIGVYSSQEYAEAAIKRLSEQPGFRDFPKLINPHVDEEKPGFYIDAYEIDKDHWTEGYRTEYY
jgi:homoserine kinase type II